MLNDHAIFIDLTGFDKNLRGAGSGGVEEIARIIGKELRRRKGKAVCIVVDYVGAMAKRVLAATNKDESAIRHIVSGAPLKMKNLLAEQFRCPVWALHQLNGEANAKIPGARIHHTDAAEARSYAENLDFAFVIGTPTLDGLCQLACTKHRRTAGMEPVIVRIVGTMNRVDATGKQYTIDGNHQIVEKKYAEATTTKKKLLQKAGMKVTGASAASGQSIVHTDDSDDGDEMYDKLGI